MANPNQLTQTSLLGVTEMQALTSSQAVCLTTTQVGALKVVDFLSVANLSTSQVSALTVQLWPAITMTGTPRTLAPAISIPVGATLVVADKTTPIKVGEAQCLSAASNPAGAELIISYDTLS